MIDDEETDQLLCMAGQRERVRASLRKKLGTGEPLDADERRIAHLALLAEERLDEVERALAEKQAQLEAIQAERRSLARGRKAGGLPTPREAQAARRQRRIEAYLKLTTTTGPFLYVTPAGSEWLRSNAQKGHAFTTHELRKGQNGIFAADCPLPPAEGVCFIVDLDAETTDASLIDQLEKHRKESGASFHIPARATVEALRERRAQRRARTDLRGDTE